MDPAKYQYQSDFARRYYGQGRADGRAEGRATGQATGQAEGLAKGRAELVVRQLALRFGALSNEVQARILAASIADLDAIGERLLTARTLQDALGADVK
jgi:predicted transposase YdaD